MNKNLSIFLVLVVAILIIWGVMSKDKSGDSMMMEDKPMSEKGSMMKDENSMMEGDEMMEKNDSMMMDEGDSMMMKGSYEAYAPEKLALAEKGDVVLFFRAPWCPTCRALDADIKANVSSIPSGVTILDVDYDSSSALKQKYGVTYQHTLVQVDKDGNQISKWMGSPTLSALVGKIK